MRPPPWFSRQLWLIVPALALIWLVWSTAARVRHIEHLSNLAPWSIDPPSPNRDSPTGYANGRRQLVIPEHTNASYQWIAQTQQMVASGQWRLGHVDYDNAPFGREVALPSPYRWWLAAVGYCDRFFSGRSLALAIEHAAYWADPLLQIILLVGLVACTSRAFGRLAASLAAVGSVAMFPLAGAFLAGAPDRPALALLCAIGTVWPLAAAIGTRTGAGARLPAGRIRGWFSVSAAAGALGLWADLDRQWPVLAGIVAGAIVAAAIEGRAAPAAPAWPWRWWGLVGCGGSLLACALEFLPDRLAWRFDLIHPLYALSWLGAAELVARVTEWCRTGRPWQRRADLGLGLLAIALTASAPIAVAWSGTRGWLHDEAAATRLTPLLGGVAAPNLGAWVMRAGSTGAVWATLLPWLLLVPATLWSLVRAKNDPAKRTALTIALGPVLCFTPIAALQLQNWSSLDGLLLVVLILLAAPGTELRTYFAQVRTFLSLAAAATVAGLGLYLMPPPGTDPEHPALSDTEIQGLVERDFAQWLAHRAGPDGAVVLAPPDLSVSLLFHGGLPVVATLYPENHDGLTAAIRLAAANSPDETLELIRRRRIGYIVLPSWDVSLDQFARLGTGMPEKSFMEALHQWALPKWLQPVPYEVPNIPGVEALSVAVFQVVDEQPEPVAAARTVEYFLESARPDNANAMLPVLRRYPAHIAAMAALAEVVATNGDRDGFDAALVRLRPRVTPAALRALPWDRRISVLLVLAQARQLDIVGPELTKCLAEVDATRLRSLSTGELFRLQLLCKLMRLEIPNPSERALAYDLLPPQFRQRL